MDREGLSRHRLDDESSDPSSDHEGNPEADRPVEL